MNLSLDGLTQTFNTLQSQISTNNLSEAINSLSTLQEQINNYKHQLVMHVRSISSDDPFSTSEKFKEGLIVYLGVTKSLPHFKVKEILFNNDIRVSNLTDVLLIEKYNKEIYLLQNQNLQHELTLFSKRFSELSYEELCKYYHKLLKEEQ